MGILNNHLISRRSVIAAGGLVAAEFLAPHTVDAAEFNSVDIPQINNSGRELVDSNGKKHFYTRNHSFPIVCGHDYRVVKA